jgi:hypothetical protein
MLSEVQIVTLFLKRTVWVIIEESITICNLDLNIFLMEIILISEALLYFFKDKLEMKVYLNKKKKSAFCTKSAFWKYFLAILT